MMTQQTQSSQKLVALILLIICSALSVNANIINVVADGTIACGSIIGATGPPWDPLDNFIHIPNTVNHVTFTGCDWDYANVIFQIDNRRIVRNEPSDTRLRIELINCNFAPAGGTWIDGTYTDFVTDVDYVGATVEFSNVRKDAMSIMGGPNTFVADTTIDISGASYSIQGWGNFASIVADTVQRAKITVMLGIQYRHVCADHDVTDVMMASMRVNHVNCVEIRLTHNNQLIFQRGYTYTGTEMVRAVIAGVVAYDGAQIDGNSVAIYLSNSGVPISAETGAVDLNTHQGLSVIGGIAALARTPTEIARVKVSNIKIVAYGKMTFVSAIKATAHTIFGVVAVGTAGAEVIAPGLAIEGQFWAGGGVSNFDIQHTVDGSAAALFGVAAAAKDGSAQIYAPNSRIFVGGPTTNTLNLNIHDYNVGDITAVSIGGMSVHSRSASGSVNNRVIADDSTFSIYGSIGKLANRRNSDDFVSCSHNPAVAYFGIVCANMGDTATTSCDVQANRVTISIGQPSAGPPNSIITSDSYVNGAGAITFGGVISYSFMANPIATGNSRVSANDIKITATGIAIITMSVADPNAAAAVLGVLSTTKSTQPQNLLLASNALITVAENYVITVQEPGSLTGYNTAIMGFACGAEGASVTSCYMTLPNTKIHVDGTLYWHDINTMTGGGQRVAALAGIACRAVTTSTTFTSACDINADNVEIIVDGDFRPKAQNSGGRGSIGNNGIASLAIGAHNSRSTIEANNARIFARSTATSGPSPFSNLVGPPTGQSAGASGGISSLAVGGTGTQLSRVRAAGLQISSSTPHLFVNSPNQPETAAAAAGVAVLAVGDAAQAEVDTSDAFIIGEGSAAQMIAAHVDMSDMSYTQVNCAGATFGVAVMALANAGGSADTVVLSPRAKLAAFEHTHSRLIMHGADSVAASLSIAGSSMQKAGAAATLTTNVDAQDAVIESVTTANTVLLCDTAGLATGTFAAAGIAAQGGAVTFDATGRTLRVCGAGIAGPMPGQTVRNGTVPASTGTDNSWVSTGPSYCPAATMSMPAITSFPSITYVTFDTSKIFPGTYFCDATPTHSHSLSDSSSSSLTDSKSLSDSLSKSPSLSVSPSASMSSSGSLSSSVSVSPTASGSASLSSSASNSASGSGSPSHSASSSHAGTATPSGSLPGTLSAGQTPSVEKTLSAPKTATVPVPATTIATTAATTLPATVPTTVATTVATTTAAPATVPPTTAATTVPPATTTAAPLTTAATTVPPVTTTAVPPSTAATTVPSTPSAAPTSPPTGGGVPSKTPTISHTLTAPQTSPIMVTGSWTSGSSVTVGVPTGLTLTVSAPGNVTALLCGLPIERFGLALLSTNPAILAFVGDPANALPLSCTYNPTTSITTVVITVVVTITVSTNCGCQGGFTSTILVNTTGMCSGGGALVPHGFPVPSGGYPTFPIGSVGVGFAPEPEMTIVRYSTEIVELRVANVASGASVLRDVAVTAEFDAPVPLRIDTVAGDLQYVPPTSSNNNGRRQAQQLPNLATPNCTLDIKVATCVFPYLPVQRRGSMTVTLRPLPVYYTGRIDLTGVAEPSNAANVTQDVFWFAGNTTDLAVTPNDANATADPVSAIGNGSNPTPAPGGLLRRNLAPRSIFEPEGWFDIWFVFYTLGLYTLIALLCVWYRHSQRKKPVPVRPFEQAMWRFVVQQHVWLSVLLPCDYRCAVYHWTNMVVTVFGLYVALPVMETLFAPFGFSPLERRATAVLVGSFFAMIPRMLVEAGFTGWGVKRNVPVEGEEAAEATKCGATMINASEDSERRCTPPFTGEGTQRCDALIEGVAALEALDGLDVFDDIYEVEEEVPSVTDEALIVAAAGGAAIAASAAEESQEEYAYDAADLEEDVVIMKSEEEQKKNSAAAASSADNAAAAGVAGGAAVVVATSDETEADDNVNAVAADCTEVDGALAQTTSQAGAGDLDEGEYEEGENVSGEDGAAAVVISEEGECEDDEEEEEPEGMLATFVTVASYRTIGWVATIVLLVCLAITTIVLVWHHTKADRHEYWVTFGWGVLSVCFIMDPLRLVAVCVFRWVKDSGYDDENPENPKDGLFNSCGSMLRWFHPNEYDAIEHIPWFH